MLLTPTSDGPMAWGGWLLMLVVLAMAPFVLTMVTSFVKLVVVGSLIRTALGTPQIPPAIVINGLAMVLTVHIMWPVGERIASNYTTLAAEKADARGGPANASAEAPTSQPAASKFSSGETLELMVESARGPMVDFLTRHANPRNVQLFQDLRTRSSLGRAPAEPGSVEHLTILVPAFVLTELTQAFQIGFLIFLPFLVIDLVVSNVLLAIGAQSLQPTLVSLPIKLLLFVLVDGWTVILRSLILGYSV